MQCQRCHKKGRTTAILSPFFKYMELCDNCKYEWNKIIEQMIILGHNFMSDKQITLSTSNRRPGYVSVANATTDTTGEITTSQLRKTTGGNNERIS